jgi:outer membrane protein OmpA-like peptidoglycan-associated protein
MLSDLAMRVVLGAGLGLGVLDLAWLNLALAPELALPERAAPERAAAERAESAALEPTELDAPGTVGAPLPRSVPSSPVYFETGSAELDARAKNALDELVRELAAEDEIAIEGHADHRGSTQRNRALSRQRAEVVAKYLVERGLSPARLQVSWVGARQPTQDHELWRDRRVEIHITRGSR